MEAADAGVALVVCITEGIPTTDMVKAWSYLKERSTRLLGPNCPGLLSPGKCKIGIMPGKIGIPGRVGVVSRSGTLTYEAVGQLSALGIGQSTFIGNWRRSDHWHQFYRCDSTVQRRPGHRRYRHDWRDRLATPEETAAAYIKDNVEKPVVGFVAGQTAPPGRRMGHAGAIISGGSGKASDKMAAMAAAGITVCETPAVIGEMLKGRL